LSVIIPYRARESRGTLTGVDELFSPRAVRDHRTGTISTRRLRRKLKRTWKFLSDAMFALLLVAAAVGLLWLGSELLSNRWVPGPARPVPYSDPK
jgi:hypothetical protein